MRTPRPKTEDLLAPERLADLAVRALEEEARLTPKPGLVDRRGPGAHDDLDLGLLLRSARSLRATFTEAAKVSRAAGEPDARLRERLGEIGRSGEEAMLAATGGSNAHRGAIWTLGLLVCGAARGAAVGEAARIANLPDRFGTAATNGALACALHGVQGARGEAEEGFPRVVGVALPALRAGRWRGVGEDVARLDALLGVMAVLGDTCLLHRGGEFGLGLVRRGAARVLASGGVSTARGRREYRRLEEEMLWRRLSPGGSADLLAAALFLDSLEFSKAQSVKGRELVPCRV